jgi:hypothetical protein
MLIYVALEIPRPYINVKHLTHFDGNFIKKFCLGIAMVELLQRRRGRRDRMVVGFTTTRAISAYHH